MTMLDQTHNVILRAAHAQLDGSQALVQMSQHAVTATQKIVKTAEDQVRSSYKQLVTIKQVSNG